MKRTILSVIIWLFALPCLCQLKLITPATTVTSPLGMNIAIVDTTSVPYVVKHISLTNIKSYIGGLTAGSATFSGLSLTTSYVVTHNFGFTPSYIIVQPRSLNAAVISWTATYTSTNFTVNFATIPLVGTNNLIIDFFRLR